MVWKIISTDGPERRYRLFTPEGEMKPLYTVRDGWAAGMKLNADTDDNQSLWLMHPQTPRPRPSGKRTRWR